MVHARAAAAALFDGSLVADRNALAPPCRRDTRAAARKAAADDKHICIHMYGLFVMHRVGPLKDLASSVCLKIHNIPHFDGFYAKYEKYPLICFLIQIIIQLKNFGY